MEKAQVTIDREEFVKTMKTLGFHLKYQGTSWGSSKFQIDDEPTELAVKLRKIGLKYFQLTGCASGSTLKLWIESAGQNFSPTPSANVKIEVWAR